MMPKYDVYFTTQASGVVTVEADDEEEAREKAWDEELPTLSAKGSGWGEPWSLELGEWEQDESVDGVWLREN
jgi:hypothetical protein